MRTDWREFFWTIIVSVVVVVGIIAAVMQSSDCTARNGVIIKDAYGIYRCVQGVVPVAP